MSSAIPGARDRRNTIIPGFGLTFGFTLTWLCLIVLIPLSAVFIRDRGARLVEFRRSRALRARARRLPAELRRGAVAAAAVNAVFGLLVAWVLVR